jgi:ribosomal protein S18 acetylase RimI-like enzyme
VPFADFTTEHAIEVAVSQAESSRFGLAIARCSVPLGSDAATDDVARAMEMHDADITIMRYPAERVEWLYLLTRCLADHVLLHADTLVYWVLSVGTGVGPSSVQGLAVSNAVDSTIIDQLTGRIFADYPNHYSANPLLSREAARAGYREWAAATPLDQALVLYEGESPIGLATTSMAPDYLEILLAGIVPEQRGRGRYPHLLSEVEKRAEQRSVPRVVISTQSQNVGVQRAWARFGFLPHSTFNTIHAIKRDLWQRQP